MEWLRYPVLLISILFCLLLGACGPETAPDRSAHGGALSAQAVVSSSPEIIAVSPITGAIELPTQAIEIVTARTLVPTPNLAASTETELDQVALTNPRPLQLPEELGQAPLGLIVWSPDSKHFLANAIGDEVLRVGQMGYSALDLYLGDGETGEVKFLAHNAGWPAWSRDGLSIYYLTGRAEGDRVRYDLYRADAALAKPELLATGVGEPGTQPAVSELADGSVVLLNQAYQVAVLDQGALTPVADLVGVEAIRGKSAGFSLAPDGHSLIVLSQDTATLVDLATPGVETRLNGLIHFSQNVAWTADSSHLAYGTSAGIFIYDRLAKSERAVAGRAPLGFPPDDQTAGFHVPVWSPDEQIILFAASTQDWERRGLLGVDSAFQFAALVDGTQWKAISDLVMTVAPDKVRAIEFRREPATGRESPTLVNLTWTHP